jgi:hypothetical protein
MTRLSRALSGFLRALAEPRTLAALFLLCVLPTGLGCALFTPVGNTPDEPQHLARTDGLRLGQVFGSTFPGQPQAGVVMNASIFWVAVSELDQTMPDKPLPPAARQKAEAITWTAEPIFCPTQMVHYLPSFYIPGALGLLAGETFGLTPLNTFFLGRIFMLLGFLLAGVAAIRLAAYGNPLIFAVLTLPTTIHLAASYNQDGQVIAACALSAALLTRAGPGPNRLWVAAAALLSLVGCSKTPYVAMLPAFAAPLGAPGLKRRILLVVLALVPPALWLVILLHGHFSPWPRAPYHPGPLWPGDRSILLTTSEPKFNIAVLKAHPAQILLLPITSFYTMWSTTWPDILGMINWGFVFIQRWEYPGLATSVIAAAAGTALAGGQTGWRASDTALAALMLFGVFLGIELSQYVTYCDAGVTVIEFAFGRYFLPLLPFFILLLPGLGTPLRRLPLNRLPAGLFCLPAIGMALVNIYALPHFILHLYQMPGP